MFVDWEIHPQLHTNMNISAGKKKTSTSIVIVNYQLISVFLISLYGAPLPKELLIWHCTVLQMAQLIMIILSLTLCLLGQDVFPMAHTLTIWPMLQKL